MAGNIESYRPGNEGGFANNSTSRIFANSVRRDFGKKELPRVLDRENLPTVDEIRGSTEVAIRSYFGKVSVGNEQNNISDYQKRVYKTLNEFASNLSTNPEFINKKVDKNGKNIINQFTLASKCEVFSNELQRCLKLVGLKSEIVEGLWITHFSLRTVGSEGEVVIDSSIGQHLEGYDNVFVGTRKELKKLVLQYAEKKKLSFIDTSGVRKNKIPIRVDPGVFFEDQWPSLSNHRRFHSEEIISSPIVYQKIPFKPMMQQNSLGKELVPIISGKSR